MPTWRAELSDDEKDRIIKWVAEKTAGGEAYRCPRCSSEDIIVGDHVVALAPATHLPTVHYPFALVVCENCGYSQLYNTVTLGISEGISPKPKPPAPAGKDGGPANV